jgi:biotin-dependent carboxylase-like uncharacterized protein
MEERPGFTVLSAGLFTTVQDFGRTGLRAFGVPAGGAADRWSLALGNALVGNADDAPALEITLLGPTLRAEADLSAVVTGAPFEVTVSGGSGLPSRRVWPGTSFAVRAGQAIRIGGTAAGARGYLCVAGGGVAVARRFDRFGDERPLSPGDRVGLVDATLAAAALRTGLRTSAGPGGFEWDREPATLRVLDGAHLPLFDPSAFLEQEYRVGPQCDRMGLRLRGTPLVRGAFEPVSEPLTPGTVQVANDGQCLLLGPAAQTVGGYPRVAHVISADLDRIGRLRPGDPVRFRRVTPAEARSALVGKLAELAVWRRRMAAALG